MFGKLGKRLKRYGKWWEKHLVIGAFLTTGMIGAITGTVIYIISATWAFVKTSSVVEPEFSGLSEIANLCAMIMYSMIGSAFLVLPIILTGEEIYLSVKGYRKKECYQKGHVIDAIVLIYGIVCNRIYFQIMHEVCFDKDWDIALYAFQKHTPIWTKAGLTIGVLVAVGIAGYLIVNLCSVKNTPPLIMVLGFSAMYIGTVVSVMWAVQTFLGETLLDGYVLLLPINCVLITARTMMHKIWEWNQICMQEKKHYQNKVLQNSSKLMEKSEYWPWLAFLFALPLLAILIVILLLFGQQPNTLIKAFTQTSDWNLSQCVAPQSLEYDGHYLCTVAAGGHKKIVKPKRFGVRHGHRVIVNRQLCIANAFEQIIEERTPKFHKIVRHIYDTYGFPVAKLIRSKYTADVVYVLMKPLEWLFLVVLYLTEPNPENRIAIQYTGKNVSDFEET